MGLSTRVSDRFNSLGDVEVKLWGGKRERAVAAALGPHRRVGVGRGISSNAPTSLNLYSGNWVFWCILWLVLKFTGLAKTIGRPEWCVNSNDVGRMVVRSLGVICLQVIFWFWDILIMFLRYFKYICLDFAGAEGCFGHEQRCGRWRGQYYSGRSPRHSHLTERLLCSSHG